MIIRLKCENITERRSNEATGYFSLQRVFQSVRGPVRRRYAYAHVGIDRCVLVDDYDEELRLIDSAARFHVVVLVGDKEGTDCSRKSLLHLEERLVTRGS